MEEKRKNDLAAAKRAALYTQSPSSLSSSSPGNENALYNDPLQKPLANPITLRLVPHIKHESLFSQRVEFVNETPNSIHARLFYVKMINDSFFKFHESFVSHYPLALCWLTIQMERRLAAAEFEDPELRRLTSYLGKLMLHYKSAAIAHLRKCVLSLIDAQEKGNFKACMYHYGEMTIPSISLQVCDILTQNNLKNFYGSGSVVALTSLYDRVPDSSAIASFIASGTIHTHRALFIPNYSPRILNEILLTLKEMSKLVDETDDEYLIHNFEQLIAFFEETLSSEFLDSHFNPEKVTAYSAKTLYTIYHKFNMTIPSEAFCIPLTNGPVHRVIYLYYFMIARVLDNIFPETRYVTKFRFIGPTSIYPFTRQDIYGGIVSDELIYYANYAYRLLAFFSRRSDMFGKYMKIDNHFPDAHAVNRFKSRKLNVNEEFVNEFKSTVLQQRHYPQIAPTDRLDTSAGHSHPAYSFNVDKDTSLNTTQLNAPNLYDTLDSGLLRLDYDPLADEIQERPCDEATSLSLHKYAEDHKALWKMFVNDQL
ncbi:CYFA0S11e00342g1_1 [Cyberlindnera fabianii]|uniref:CYFA0S11e00342g1_1 n=1 Tax=Cyberlindnera fabianii TaxID=36022 RepID=A0A061AZN7_CYBFA|nr:CYFA0S11e00342g1_1 [Cyberlindnera fabianii]